MTVADARSGNGRTPRGLPVEDRFWAKVSGGDISACWTWLGAPVKGTGYGVIRVEGRGILAHRWAYEHLRADIPDGLHLDHLCRNRLCVNPWHLEPVTPAENTRRGHGNGSQVECPQGHPYDAENTYRWKGRRYCRTCNKYRAGEWRRAKLAA